MKRHVLTTLLRVAGYHEDTSTLARLCIENPISKRAADEAFRSGRQARAAGVRCLCVDCKAGVVIPPLPTSSDVAVMQARAGR